MFHTQTHTHTHPAKRGQKLRSGLWSDNEDEKGDENEMKMKMKWKLLNRKPRRGTQKRRGGTKREHQHQHTLPERANPEKARERKSGGRRENTKTSGGGGKDGRAWTKLTPAKTKPTWAHTEPDLPGEGSTHEIGDPWGPSWLKTKTNQ